MGYPAAYRTASRAYSGIARGFQSSAPSRASGNVLSFPQTPARMARLAKAASNNFPKAANDNFAAVAEGRAAVSETALGAFNRTVLRRFGYLALGVLVADLLYRWVTEAKPVSGLDWSGWTLEVDCGNSGGDLQFGTYACGTHVVVAGTEHFGVQTIGNLSRTQIHNFNHSSGSFNYYDRGNQYSRSGPNAPYDPVVDQPGVAMPMVPQLPIPSIDPLSLPIGQPVPTPRPAPRALVPHIGKNPYRSEREQSDRGYRIEPEYVSPLAPGPTVTQKFDVGRAGATDPFGVPETTVDNTPRFRPRARPKKNEKERKVTIRDYVVVDRAIGAVTEGLDFVSALYKALPERDKFKLVTRNGVTYRVRIRSFKDKAAAVYQHLEDVDVGKAIGYLAYNELQDRLFGRVGRSLGHARRYGFEQGYTPGGPFGYQTGPAL